MNRQPSPKIIGAFVVAALVVLVGMVAFLGSAALFGPTERYILFFDQSVNGLQVGSPVKFRGVPIGTVERVMIRAEGQRADSDAIPVIIKLDSARLQQDLGLTEGTPGDAGLVELLERGLVAQLNLESFITGQLFVEFSFASERSQHLHSHLTTGQSSMSEIPTLTSSLDQITGDIAQLIADFGAIDLPRLNRNVNTVLENLAVVLAGVDSQEFTKATQAMRQAFVSIQATADSFNFKNGEAGDVVAKLSQQMTRSLSGVDRLLAEAESVMRPDSTVRYEFTKTLRELSRAAQSVRLLTDYLERNPNALLTGRPADEE